MVLGPHLFEYIDAFVEALAGLRGEVKVYVESNQLPRLADLWAADPVLIGALTRSLYTRQGSTKPLKSRVHIVSAD